MDHPTPSIYWHEGLFLRPQHFQKHSRWVEDTIAYKNSFASPYRWGIVDMEIDKESLLADPPMLVVHQVDAIMPPRGGGSGWQSSGDLLSFQASGSGSDQHLERNLAEFSKYFEREDTLPIFLAVPRPASRMVEPLGGSGSTRPVRYSALDPVKVPDETTGEADETSYVSFLEVNSQIVIGPEAEKKEEHYVLMKIAELGGRGGRPYLTDFIPPLVKISAKCGVAPIVKDICGMLRDRCSILVEKARGDSNRDDKLELLDTRLQAMACSGSVLPLEQMLSREVFHPMDFYLQICRLIGELSAVSSDTSFIMPRSPAKYEHLDPGATFRALKDQVRELLPRPPSNWLEVASEKQGEGLFTAELEPDQLDREICMAVYVDSNTDTARLHQWVVKNCTIGSGAQIRELASNFSPGIGREAVDPPPQGLYVRNKELVYKLIPDQFFAALRNHTTLCFARQRKAMEGTVAPRSLKVFVKKPG